MSKPNNVACIRVCKKCGLKRGGYLNDKCPHCHKLIAYGYTYDKTRNPYDKKSNN